VALILGAAGCLFSTREPQAPGSGEDQCPPAVLTSPDTLVNSLVEALGCRDSRGAPTGEVNYEQLFSDDFQFHPDPGDSLEIISADPTLDYVFASWPRQTEIDVFRLWAGSVDRIRLDLSNRDVTPSGDSAIVRVDYALTAYNGSDSTFYGGVARFSMVQALGTWKIILWTDERSDSTSWTRLRAALRQQIGH
jgi:hypothetical protein